MNPSTTDVPLVPWDELLDDIHWDQGEHVSLLGPTGQGKTTLALHMLREREQSNGYVCILATKPRDRVLRAFAKDRGYRIIRDWPPDTEGRRFVLWPPFGGLADVEKQRDVFLRALADMFSQEAWCVYIDELHYLTDALNLDKWAKILWLQGRSLDMTLVAGTQRPRHVPLEAYSQATHLFMWRTNDREDLRRLSELGAANIGLIRDTVVSLPPYHALYAYTRGDYLAIVKAPPPEWEG